MTLLPAYVAFFCQPLCKPAVIPQVQVVTAEKGDVEEIVDATGTVGSEEEKTYYSPVNAELKTVSFSQGDVVKKGTKQIEFNTEDLEKDNRKAELNLKSTKYDTKDTRNKSALLSVKSESTGNFGVCCLRSL